MLSLNKYLKICRLLTVCIFLFKNSTSQNLIQNGSFEISTNNDCYGSFDHHTFPNPHILDSWYNYNSPDYFSSVCSVGAYSVPFNLFGINNAKHGATYVGIYIYSKDTENKEYIYQQLTAPLQSGKIYCLNFYISRADKIPFAIKNMGAYFSNSLPPMVTNYYINATPQVLNQSGFLSDTINWMEIQGCFTAQGGEQYITIGNFNSNANTDTLRIQSTDPLTGAGNDIAYYYIDDVTLIDQTTVGLENMNYESGVMNVYPNPAMDVLNVGTNFQNKENLTIKITDVIGREILITDYKEQLDISFLERGIYFVSILQGNKTLGVRKIVKE
ncbi:MAG: T9SS type A sorting domain-containing protein [Bacteroidota bacterium]